MNTTSRRFLLLPLTLVLLLSALFTGCRSTPAPDPSMTAVRSSSGSGTDSSADWIRARELERAGDVGLGLEERNLDMMRDGDRVEGLFPSVYFEFDQSFIRPQDRPMIQQVADYLVGNPNVSLLIEGHCDWRGTTEYNLALGGRRAQSVRDYLGQLGIAPSRMDTLSKGDLEATTNGDEAQMARDRRADFIFFR